MQLSPREKDKLLVAMAAIVARKRLERGVKLNHPEAIALITDYVVEGARDGRKVAELMRDGATVISRAQVMDGIAEMIPEIQVEATFPTGPSWSLFTNRSAEELTMKPGEIITAPGMLTLNAGRETLELEISNTGDRPIQVGSHYHFYETNEGLSFDREAARGFRLDIPAGTAVRFEPGQTRSVQLVAYAGDRIVSGFNAKINGKLEG